MSKIILKTIAIGAIIIMIGAATAKGTPQISASVGLSAGSAPKNLAIAESISTPTVYITNSATSSLTIIPLGDMGWLS